MLFLVDPNDTVFNPTIMVGVVCLALFTMLGGVLATLQIVAAWKKLTTPPPPKDPLPLIQQYVTRGELDQQTAMLLANVNKLETDVKSELTKTEARLSQEVKSLHTYAHDSFHRMAHDLNALSLKHEAGKLDVYTKIKEQVEHSTAPLSKKLDDQSALLNRILTRLIPLQSKDGDA